LYPGHFSRCISALPLLLVLLFAHFLPVQHSHLLLWKDLTVRLKLCKAQILEHVNLADHPTSYVAPEASCSDHRCRTRRNGSRKYPWTSIEAARNDVQSRINKQTNKDIIVKLLPGTYRLSSPLTFGPEDAAPSGSTITYQGDAGAELTNAKAVKPALWTGKRLSHILPSVPWLIIS
jgi:hypothetical protein